MTPRPAVVPFASPRRRAGIDAPVCVDLDGTLITGDLLWESFAALCRRRPFRALKALFAMLRGRAFFKQRVAESIDIDPAALSYRRELLDELTDLHRQGAHLVLATASHHTYAHAVANHLKIFAEVMASDGRSNLSGHRKAASLVARYGQRGFDYVGNGWADVPVWQAAAGATVVDGPRRLVHQLARTERPHRVFSVRRGALAAWVSALRPHQWVKNVLVFVPLITSHRILRLDLLAASVLAFVAFSLCASAIYILNDISDIQADRAHPRKRRRPFAAGELSIPAGGLVAAALMCAAAAVAFVGVSWQLAAVLGIYVIVTSAYTLRLKRTPVADVFTLTGLYVLRIVAGGVAAATMLSSWLLAFALFIFLSLAFVKRYVELLGTKAAMPGRAYGPEDAMWMHAIGTSAGYMAVLVLAMYVSAPEVTVLYARPQVLWLLCPMLLFWITRLWFRAGRQLVHDDPVVEALKDPLGYIAAAAASVILLAATL